MPKFLVIQTAFIGDVVLATAILEKFHDQFPEAEIDMMVRKGNEGLLQGHPFLHELLVWDKKKNKLRNLWILMRRVRRRKYDVVVNVQRFAATGLLTVFSGAVETIGFDKNPFSRFFTRRIQHIVTHNGSGNDTPDQAPPAGKFYPITMHEIDRNQALIEHLTGADPARPRLYPTAADEERVASYRRSRYITISPASVWFTKQYPKEKWIDFLRKLPPGYDVYLLGAPSDQGLCEEIRAAILARPADAIPSGSVVLSQPGNDVFMSIITNLAGKLSFLQSAALMRDAVMNFVNDSAPMHFASAVNAPVTVLFCSTIPGFGFGPLSDRRFVVEIDHPLDCRPCGLHGYRACPKGHFRCAREIRDEQLLAAL